MRYILLFLLLGAFTANAQTRKTKELLKEIENQWYVDDAGTITYQRILELPNLGQNEGYSRALNFFIYDSESKPLRLNEDKVLGRRVAECSYENFHTSSVFMNYTNLHSLYIIRVDVKEGRARILLTLTSYDIETGTTEDESGPSVGNVKISQTYPANEMGRNKTMMGKAFYYTHSRAQGTIDRLSKAMEEGNVRPTLQHSDWK